MGRDIRSFSISNKKIVLEKDWKRPNQGILNRVILQLLQEIGAYI